MACHFTERFGMNTQELLLVAGNILPIQQLPRDLYAGR